jgi:1-acyl-sn-glycerol-3-phosphate acyltransferase
MEPQARFSMADIKPQVYKDPRPAERFQRFHDWVRTHRPGWIYELARMLLTPIALILYRERAIGTPNVPADGGFILAPNHFSQMDHFFAGIYIRRKIQFMAKSQLFGNPVLDYIFRVGGVFPVRRGHHDEEAFKTAYAVLGRDGCVGMYCEGGRSRSGRLGEAKPGVGRLALESGAPVVPVAIHGSLGVRRWKRLQFPKVTVQYGEPIRFEREVNPSRGRQLEVAEEIFERVKRMYGVLEAEGRRAAAARINREAATRSAA